jgi:hypothetical protein
MNKETFISGLDNATNTFQQTMDYIDNNFTFEAVAFTVGEQVNEQGTNQGSCKIFCLGKFLELTEAQTLQCFGDFYRKDVVEHPDATDHQNIRNFIKAGWAGVTIDASALKAKAA